MGDAILFGVLRMPPAIWGNDEMDKIQRYARHIEAADEIEALRARVAELEAAIGVVRRRGPPMTALGEYRAGYLHALEVVSEDLRPRGTKMKRGEQMKPVERLMYAMDLCALARGEANWTNGYRTGRPDKEVELYPKEREQWQNCDVVEARFRRVCNEVLREVRKPKKRRTVTVAEQQK